MKHLKIVFSIVDELGQPRPWTACLYAPPLPIPPTHILDIYLTHING